MRGRKRFFLGIAWALLLLFFLSAMFTAAYLLTAYFYKITHLTPPDLLVQLINSLLGLIFTGLVAGSVATFSRSRGWVPEMKGFGPIMEALERIAKGDFSIRLENDFRDNQIVSELANSVNQMAVELDQMETMRQEFISNISHEIQSPLTSIRGFAQALEDENLGIDERRSYLHIIEAESTRLSRITEDLLKLAALESEHAKFEPKSYRLDRQIRSLVLACEPQWMAKKIDMEVNLDEVNISADEDLLSQVWMNLIHNSIKFTPECGRVQIELHRQDDDWIEFKVTDSGLGISEEDQARIFERFYKADPSRTRSNGGSGLGLSIAKKIVEMHQGGITVKSRLGAGTTFTVSLPLG